MGPCMYCGEMIYLDWIAERGYHRACYEKDEAKVHHDLTCDILLRAARIARHYRKAEKRRIRRAEIRRQKKAGTYVRP